jgi:hypothetical protein
MLWPSPQRFLKSLSGRLLKNMWVSCETKKVCVKRKKYFSGALDILTVSNFWSSHLTTYQFLHSHLFFQTRIFDLVELFVLAPCNWVDEAKKTFVYLYQTVGQKSCVSSGTFSAPPKCRFRGNLFEGHSGKILYRIDEQVSRSIDLLVLTRGNNLSTQAYQKPVHCYMILGRLLYCYWRGELKPQMTAPEVDEIACIKGKSKGALIKRWHWLPGGANISFHKLPG